MVKLAIVVPCYNEEEVLNETSKRLLSVIDKLVHNNKISPESYILFVNDGSKDNTWMIISELHELNDTFCGLSVSRNVGHQKALLAGLEFVSDKCDVAISIDADLQDDVNAIEEMIDKHAQGNDIVYGVRSSREKDSFFKKHTALVFYKLMSALGVETVYNHADFRLMSSRALNALLEYKERNLFLRGIMPLIGYQTDKVYYKRDARFAGTSKYPFNKMLSFAINGITSFSVKPLRIISLVGVISLIISLISLIYILISYFSGNIIQGWSSMMASIWFIGSLIIISLGVIGEYVGKIYIEVKERPLFNIEKTLFKDDKTKL
ncbi:glycosyltransferase family 2 protein [Bacteroidales bacterium OttesenSCG-928-B11]|nr:glycosyltransferase family 2 protein [Bacteroidales bacterium OttesenSCG-928-C03]MDL2311812.1 glycosyltransferase family 2 protein [Bacteroidales bacterium OttesenSCG-928-B11]MDL2326183.1 glycosyltransferase family 2 protein [Bacteroidales bacterium OttesenSCG-928-A14]